MHPPVCSFPLRNLCNSLYGLARSGFFEPAVYDAIAARIIQLLQQPAERQTLVTQNLTDIVRSFAEAGRYHELLFDTIAPL